MAVAIIDTNVLVARASRRDQNHEAARAVVDGIDRGDLPSVRVTNYVVTETLNYIHERQHHALAVDLYDRLAESTGFELVHLSKTDFSRAVELFERYDGLAFADATIAAYMERAEIEYLYSFDDDFDTLDDITRLASATNPFDSS
ncbi:PIN domain-containing protein [Halorussus salilacus]|uniref:type II toxin-antitoxin system VapC family toxin n=1 Tax=Halorussus salilacus TaxID=2953750 RepID=UPI00209EB4A7|nr:PIN domain-containing protein [Halorussus salilacus]USZ68622.1 PIN domain-containing protein [Halorussus salilacus]